ncbi:MAG: tyrosine--tRNA ligase [Mycoplasma sp.]
MHKDKITIKYLQDRNIIKDITNVEKLEESIKEHKGIYCGFDPTAESLHLGNYVQIVALKWFAKAGLKPIIVLGGATGMIGDPSGKKVERKLLSSEDVLKNEAKIRKQVENLVCSNVEIINNKKFYENLTFIDFLREAGKYANVSNMIAKDQIKKRIDEGISYTEFSYMMLQGWDFYQLYQNNNCTVQIGGSDQWGNITFGVELIRKIISKDNLACGLTFNLLTKTDGTKFGKTETGTIWLDQNMTNSYELYQFFLNQEDDMLEKLFYSLTLKSNDEIKEILKDHFLKPELRKGQKELSYTIITDLHGKNELEEVLDVSRNLFENDFSNLSTDSWQALYKNLRGKEINTNNLMDILLIDICKSKREARELISNGSLTFNGQKITNENFEVVFKNEYLLIKKGKRSFFIYKKTRG